MLFLPGIHLSSRPWYYGCITLYYGQGEYGWAEHGNDLSCFNVGTPVTALLGGRVTYAGYTAFGFYEVTWRLSHPWLAHGSPYAYVEDMQSLTVYTGETIHQGQVIGYSESWVEFGLTPDYAYGISNWRWGIDSYFLIREARNGTLPKDIYHPAHKTQKKFQQCVHCSITQLLQVGTAPWGSHHLRPCGKMAREQVPLYTFASVYRERH